MKGKALADLGAIINVMSYKLFLKLRLGKQTPTWMTLQLADISERHPRGVIEDVLVKVDKLIHALSFSILYGKHLEWMKRVSISLKLHEVRLGTSSS